MITKHRIYNLVDKLNELWEELTELDKNSDKFKLKKEEIEKLTRIIKPVGETRRFIKKEGDILICQFRYTENNKKKSKNYNPNLHEIIQLKLQNGATIEEILTIIKNNEEIEFKRYSLDFKLD